MRSYRESFRLGWGRRGLSQEELLRRMGEVDPDYSQRFSHTTVSRWESGATRPTVQRLRTFGMALNLTDEEVAGLIRLAGLAPDYQAASEQSVSGGGRLRSSGDGDNDPESGEAPSSRSIPSESISPLFSMTLRFFVFRFLLPGALIAGFHYLLSALGWNNTWMPVVCIAFAFLVVMGQGFVLPDRSAGLREFYWISVFFVLTTPLLQFAPLGMDHYNFHLVSGFGTTMMPYLLALLVNLGLAWGAGLLFHLLWRWTYRDGGSVGSPVSRAASATIPPLGLVYAAVVIITNFSVTIQLSVVFAVLPAAFSLLLFFRDPGVVFTEQDRRTMFMVLLVAACVGPAVGIAVIMSIYLSPDFPSVLPDHNLVTSWELDFDAMGYNREEALDRVNLGYIWHAMCLMIYMAFVVGGRLFVEVHGLGIGGEPATELPCGGARAAVGRSYQGRRRLSFFLPWSLGRRAGAFKSSLSLRERKVTAVLWETDVEEGSSIAQ